MIKETLLALQQQIQDCISQSSDSDRAVTLLAVSKGQSIKKMQEAIAAGQRHFGENYLQEALEKIAHLQNQAICWHFIGPIQSRKCADIARHFSWVHSVDRLKVARLLSQHRSATEEKLQICIQVNLDEERQKAGVSQEECLSLIEAIRPLEHIEIRGLMCIPSAQLRLEDTKKRFQELRTLLETINHKTGLHMDTLSMGMSQDMALAIASGSTMVRIGRALFGERDER